MVKVKEASTAFISNGLNLLRPIFASNNRSLGDNRILFGIVSQSRRLDWRGSDVVVEALGTTFCLHPPSRGEQNSNFFAIPHDFKTKSKQGQESLSLDVFIDCT